MITGNEPAYPTIEQDNVNGNLIWNTVAGLTIRQHFAAMAMQGLVANSEHRKWYKKESYLMPYEIYAEQAVDLADALIKELNKQL